MMARDMAATAALVCLSTVGVCGQPGVEDGVPASAPSAGDVAGVHPATKPQRVTRGLDADERRVKLLVLPADAEVEVDGVPVRRRDGVIELSGKVGQTHRVRLSRDAQHAETTVTLQDADASPPSLDLAALVRAARPLGRGRLPTAASPEPAAAEASATPEPAATAEPAPEATLPEAMQGAAQANEGQAGACPPATQVVVYRCPPDAAAAARGKKRRGVLAGDSFE